MRLTFRLRFHTRFGQDLFLASDHPWLGGGLSVGAVPLRYRDADHWEVSLELPGTPDAAIRYHYVLREPDGTMVHDWGRDKVLRPEDLSTDDILLLDSWNNAAFYENAFYTEPFERVLLRSERVPVTIQMPRQVTHVFKVKAPLLKAGQTLGLLGTFNHWDPAAPVLLGRNEGEGVLKAGVDLSQSLFPITYKYAVYELSAGPPHLLDYEAGANRVLPPSDRMYSVTRVDDGFARLPSTTWRGAGVAVPVFSLRTEASFGIGEFSDLKPMAIWCRQTGLKLLQLVPVNDTSATHTWTDSYPYAAISAFALHPGYIDLKQVVSAKNRKLLDTLEPERRRLNALPAVDYEAVMSTKLAFLRRVFPLEQARVFRSKDYKVFFEENRVWLVPYAVFCHLRDRFGTSDFSRWPELSRFDSAVVEKLAEPGSPAHEDVGFHLFVQFHLHRQLQEATDYARQQGVILKGDIPIGVYRYGADAWQNPELYHLEVQAGAPPDAFAVKGQNWGFPTYNWPRMELDGFAWWKQRFEQMAHYFDAFRIDHILGFFRIWSIPQHAVEGILGYFVPALPILPIEFADRSIPFERARFLEPYITDAILEQIFGTDAAGVRAQFLEPGLGDRYRLKPEFTTQRQVEAYFASLDGTPENAALKTGLYDLVSNVLLFEQTGIEGPEYHFRFNVQDTLSFQALPLEVQLPLTELYVDYFFRRQDAFWMKEAMKKLPALKQVTNMLVCGEDLGLVPHCVPEVMRQLGLLSLEIQRMPKNPGQAFFRPHESPYLAVVTPSTHDMSTIRGWWEEDPALTQSFHTTELGLPGTAPTKCSGALNRLIILQHLSSPAMWSIFQLQDLLGMDETLRRADPHEERINVPANPRNYWQYRLHLTLEQLLDARQFNDRLRADLSNCGR